MIAKLKSNGDDNLRNVLVTLYHTPVNETFCREGLNKIGTKIFIADFKDAHHSVSTDRSAATLIGVCRYSLQSKSAYGIYFRQMCERFVGLATCVWMCVLERSYWMTKAV
jgi:hypothetical protein